MVSLSTQELPQAPQACRSWFPSTGSGRNTSVRLREKLEGVEEDIERVEADLSVLKAVVADLKGRCGVVGEDEELSVASQCMHEWEIRSTYGGPRDNGESTHREVCRLCRCGRDVNW